MSVTDLHFIPRYLILEPVCELKYLILKINIAKLRNGFAQNFYQEIINFKFIRQFIIY